MRYSTSIACILAAQAPAVAAFQSTPNNIHGLDMRSHSAMSTQRQERSVFRHGVSAYMPAGEVNDDSRNGTSTSDYLTNLVTDAVQTDDDAEEIELAERRRKITERSGSFRVTMPLVQQVDKTVSEPAPLMGMRFRQFNNGRAISEQVLNLDSFVIETLSEAEAGVNERDGAVLETISNSVMQERLAPNFAGVFVSNVLKGGPAWNAGIRPGDLVTSTAATFGDSLWPKTTLEGVKSAISSRRMVAGSATFEFIRTDVQATDNTYELTLPKPIGLNLRETEDGYVEVLGFTANAPNLVRSACLIGDRVIAVESSLGGQMWPVSTVEGVISACTGRLPGQQVTLRFERPEANIGDTAVMEKSMAAAAEARTLSRKEAETMEVLVGATADEKVLLKRCRAILQRYALEEQDVANAKPTLRTSKFVDKFAVRALVADKVMEALAKESVSLDAVTLSMTMDAYLSCGKPDDAIKAFEAAVGFSGNGSTLPPKALEGNDGNRIKASVGALNAYTISSLLKAHAQKVDLKSVRRVVAAMEGRAGKKISGLQAAVWPGTGDEGVIVPDATCYNMAISAGAKARTADGLQLVMQVFNSMSDPSLIMKADTTNGKPEKNDVTYNSVISALTLAGKFEDAFTVFTNMKRVGLRPDKFTYTSLLKACVHEGDLQELLYDMKEQGVDDDVVLYNTMIRSLCDEGKMPEARTVVTQMESKGVIANSKTYGILMKGLLNAGKPGACLALFESASQNEQTSQLAENVYMYTTAITAAATLGDHERALDLVSRMSAIGIKPNMKTLTSLMGACLSSERPDLGAEVFKKIESPDGYAMSQGLKAFCRSGDLVSAAEMLSDQKRGSRTLSGKQLMEGYETIITAALKCGDYDAARSMFTELLAKSYIPSKSTLRAFVGAMGLSGLSARGQHALEVEEHDPEQFRYLLFLIDSIQQRKLTVDSYLYAAAIVGGTQLGEQYKQVAMLLVQSRAESQETDVPFDDNQYTEPSAASSWEELLAGKHNALKELRSDKLALPSLKVPVAKRDFPTVLFAEKFVNRAVQEQANENTAKAFA